MTLVGFLREGSFNLYAGEPRLTAAAYRAHGARGLI